MVRKLLYLNGLATICVVLYHSALWGYVVMFYSPPVGEPNFNQLGSIGYFGLRAMDQLVIFAIPTFIFVSGYFIAVATAQHNKTIEWTTVLNRIKVLAFPFLIWSTLTLLVKMMHGEQFALFDFVFTIITGRAAPRFYFIPLLMQLYMLAPILVLLTRKWTKATLTVSIAIQVLILLLRYISVLYPDQRLFAVLSHVRLFSAYIFWFVFGIVVGINLASIKTKLAGYKYLLLAGVFVFFCIGMIEGEILYRFSAGALQIKALRTETFIDQLYALFIILSFLAFEKNKYPVVEQISYLGARSYPIYLTHTFALETMVDMLYRFLPVVMDYQILFQPILIFIGLAFPLLLMYFVEKTPIRKYYRYLFG